MNNQAPEVPNYDCLSSNEWIHERRRQFAEARATEYTVQTTLRWLSLGCYGEGVERRRTMMWSSQGGKAGAAATQHNASIYRACINKRR